MWDSKTGRIHISRDITWLNHMYFKTPPDDNSADSEAGKSDYPGDFPTNSTNSTADTDYHEINLEIPTNTEPNTTNTANDTNLKRSSTEDTENLTSSDATDSDEVKSVHEDNEDNDNDSVSTTNVEDDKGEVIEGELQTLSLFS